MRLPNLTIPIGTAVSNSIDITGIEEMAFYGPSALSNATAVQVSPDGGTTWYPSGSVITAVVRTTLSHPNAELLRLLSAGNEVAERVIAVYGSHPKINA